MKKFGIFLAMLSIFGLVLITDAHSATNSSSIESQADIPVYGPAETDLGADPAEWGESSLSIELADVNEGWPVGAELGEAVWITGDPSTMDETAYRLFSDSMDFTPSCTDSNPEGTVYVTANNSVTVYINDGQPVEVTDVSEVSSIPFTPVSGENTFNFVVATEGSAAEAVNPAGLIYRAEIISDTPKVVWLPPMVKSNRAILKNGTTLPIKFRLLGASGVIRTPQNVYLEITDSNGNPVAQFNPGKGARSLRFAPGSGMYITNLKTKLYGLTAGAQYTLAVKDGCSDQILESKQIQIFGKKQPGNKDKKNQK